MTLFDVGSSWSNEQGVTSNVIGKPMPDQWYLYAEYFWNFENKESFNKANLGMFFFFKLTSVLIFSENSLWYLNNDVSISFRNSDDNLIVSYFLSFRNVRENSWFAWEKKITEQKTNKFVIAQQLNGRMVKCVDTVWHTFWSDLFGAIATTSVYSHRFVTSNLSGL